MSEFAPAPEPGSLAVGHQETLTPAAIEALLADFRSWLEQAAQAGIAQQPASEPSEAAWGASASGPPLDLHTLLAQFTALRHEVNLQTKASRVQQEQNAQALQDLEKALEALEDARAAPEGDAALRPLLKTLIDLHDNLSLAQREVQRTQDVLRPLVEQLRTALPPSALASSPENRGSSWLGRWLGADSANASLRERVRALEAWQQQIRQAAERAPRLVSSLITGYTMSLNRVERALQQHDLEGISALGMPFDPETMEVVEVVHEPGRISTEVIEEVRRGYLWNGSVFRVAQVKVARATTN